MTEVFYLLLLMLSLERKSLFSAFPSRLSALPISPLGARLHGNRLGVVANLSTVAALLFPQHV